MKRRSRAEMRISIEPHRTAVDCLSVEAATEAIREFDHDSVRISYIGGLAARPFDGCVVELKPKAEAMDTPNGLVNVVHHKSHMIDVDVIRLVGAFGHFEKTDVEAVAVSENAPAETLPFTLLLDLDPKQARIEIDGPVEIADGKIYVVDAACVDGLRSSPLLN